MINPFNQNLTFYLQTCKKKRHLVRILPVNKPSSTLLLAFAHFFFLLLSHKRRCFWAQKWGDEGSEFVMNDSKAYYCWLKGGYVLKVREAGWGNKQIQGLISAVDPQYRFYSQNYLNRFSFSHYKGLAKKKMATHPLTLILFFFCQIFYNDAKF